MNHINYSMHAQQRMGQRGFNEKDIELLHQYGSFIDDTSLLMTNKDIDNIISVLKSKIKIFERLRGSKLVFGNNVIITCYHPTEKHKKKTLRKMKEKYGD